MERGEILEGEVHPSTSDALNYLSSLNMEKLSLYLEFFSSCAIESNHLAEICAETLRRYMDRKKLGERYILGLAWQIRKMEEEGKLERNLS